MKMFLSLLFVTVASTVIATPLLTTSFHDETKALTSNAQWQGKDGWVNATITPCRQRFYGVALGTETETRQAMGMQVTFDEPQPITFVSITCYASTKKAFEAEEVSLTLVATDSSNESEQLTQLFSFDEASTITKATPKVLTFSLTSQNLISDLTIQNTSAGDFYFEVGEVALYKTPPPLTATLYVSPYLPAGEKASASVTSIIGGTNAYNEDYQFLWFIDEEPTSAEGFYFADRYTTPFEFTVPETEGEHTVTFRMINQNTEEITDTTKTFITTLQLPPSKIEISNLSRKSFDLTWDNESPVAPISHTITLKSQKERLSTTLIPQWTADNDGNMIAQVALPIANADQCEFDYIGFEKPLALGDKQLEYSFDNQKWRTLLIDAFVAVGSCKGTLYLRINACESFNQNLHLLIIYRPTNVSYTKEIPAEGQLMQASFDQLPTSGNFRLDICANYANGQTRNTFCNIELPPLDSFKSIQQGKNTLYFVWPDDTTIVEGQYTFSADLPTETQGLYLSRVFHATGSMAGKGIVLTNTTEHDIDLSAYTLLYTRVKNNSSATLPLTGFVIPAKSECFFVYSNPTIELPENVNILKKTALNLADGNRIALLQGTTEVNALSIKTGHVTRLNPSTHGETFIAYADDPQLSALHTPWVGEKVIQSKTLSTTLVKKGDEVSYNLTTLQQAYPDAVAFWVHAVTTEGNAQSAPLSKRLWTLPVPTKGYRLRLK